MRPQGGGKKAGQGPSHRTPVWDDNLQCYRVALTNGKYSLVDKEDFGIANSRNWRWQDFGEYGYARGASYRDGKHHTLTLHVAIMKPERGVFIDHIDGNGLNNRRSNLRYATNRQNQANSRKQNGTTSKYKGVSFFKRDGNWRASIETSKDGKRIGIHLGMFDCEKQAALAYNEKAKELFGDFARLNEVSA